MSYVMFRDRPGTEYYFTSSMWAVYLAVMRQYGWEPKGTASYGAHPVVGLQWGATKDARYAVKTSTAEKHGHSPEDLARHAAEHNGLDYGEALQSYREQWPKGELWVPTYREPRWEGSYVINNAQYVEADDAMAMSVALARAADDMEKGNRYRYPEDYYDESQRGFEPPFFLVNNDDQEDVKEDVDALRGLSAWMAKGEFRIC